MRNFDPKSVKPEYVKNGKKIYMPGFVDSYQKPWYTTDGRGHAVYYGRFCKEGYPGEVSLEFDPLKELINKIENIDSGLKEKIFEMIDELEDANYQQWENHMDCLPSAD